MLPPKCPTKVLMTCWPVGLILWSSSTHAIESSNNQTFKLNKPAYFTTWDGESVQLKPSNYVLAASPDSLQVLPTGGTPPLELFIELKTHNQELSEPMTDIFHLFAQDTSLSKSAALREGMLKVMEQSKGRSFPYFSHPYAWAPFFLVGDGQ